MFNIYYINYSKVFEIRMLFNNTLKIGRNVENTNFNNTQQEFSQSENAKVNIEAISVETKNNFQRKVENSETLRMLETLEIKNTNQLY